MVEKKTKQIQIKENEKAKKFYIIKPFKKPYK